MTAATPKAETPTGTQRFLNAQLSQQVQFLTARARAKGTLKANEALADLDLKVRQYSVLSLAASGLKPTQRELGNFLELDPSQIVALVDQLEARGLVAREPDPRDRRSKIVISTGQGDLIHKEATKRLHEAEDESLSALNPQEREQLRLLLLKSAF